MIYLYIAILFVLVIILFFSSKTLSPIPYFPSNKKDLPLIIKSLDLKNNQAVIDLGAGDGIVIFEAAKKAYQKGLNTQFIAVEINPILILIMFLKKLFHPNKKNIRIIREDFFNFNIKKYIRFYVTSFTFYVYLSPWFIDKIIKNLKLKIKNFTVVSYMYPIKSLQRKKSIFKGKNKIYCYQINQFL